MEINRKLQIFYITSVFSMIFAVLGFGYNAWRMEITEDNSNIRTAAFEVLTELSEMQQMIYAAHYDKDLQEGSPRKIWVKVGLIVDLSGLISAQVETEAMQLESVWSESWQQLNSDETKALALVSQIDSVRNEIKMTLKNLQ